MTAMKDDIGAMHKDALLKVVERQRNEAISREAQKDAVIALLQSHAAATQALMQQKDVQIAELTTALAAAEKRKKPRAA